MSSPGRRSWQPHEGVSSLQSPVSSQPIFAAGAKPERPLWGWGPTWRRRADQRLFAAAGGEVGPGIGVAKPFHLDVVSPESIVWSGEATMLVTRTTEGEIGILADHEPMMAALATGSSEIHGADGRNVTLAIHGGFLQVFQNEVTLLTDRAEVAEGDSDQAGRLARALAEAEES